MKLLSSTFSSSSSSSTISTATSFDSKSPTASCLAGILRRILCSGTLPTYPSDHVTEEEACSTKSFHSAASEKAPSREAGPGLVARLMGLDSMPETDFRASISRSRSMNSADRASGDRENNSSHRRVKSSASFREAPTFLELEDKEFFVLSFESVSDDRGREFGSKQRRRVRGKRGEENKAVNEEDREEKRKVLSDLNGKEVTRRRNSIDHKPRSISNNNMIKDQTVSLVHKKASCQKHIVGSDSVKPRKPKNRGNVVNPNFVKPGLKKKKKKKKKKVTSQVVKPLEPELNSEDSSPVSVLDCGQFLVDPKVPISEVDSSSRRKLSLETEEDHLERPSQRRDDNLIESKEWKYVGSRKKASEISQENSNVLDDIWRLSETELLGASWSRRLLFGHEDFQGVGEELEVLILDHLLEELVDQFD